MRLVRLDIDPYESLPLQRGCIDVVRLNEVLGLPTKSLHVALIEQTNQRRYSDVFRFPRELTTFLR
ncbi:hypothetical protein LMG26411_04326 [Cupriavidus numazuensis]|uniref:Uncharacterized protein n=1 Tax=Cupriavidus numazuensis TaxID=221992 RepID=A0ABM8TL92_9BURK|nr:hypothetical protein LMG26411_04326 [Cupriavidus numazuensis]